MTPGRAARGAARSPGGGPAGSPAPLPGPTGPQGALRQAVDGHRPVVLGEGTGAPHLVSGAVSGVTASLIRYSPWSTGGLHPDGARGAALHLNHERWYKAVGSVSYRRCLDRSARRAAAQAGRRHAARGAVTDAVSISVAAQLLHDEGAVRSNDRIGAPA